MKLLPYLNLLISLQPPHPLFLHYDDPRVPLYSVFFPHILSATIFPYLLAGQASGIIVGFLFTKSITSTASPKA